jgi:hypothetical protein
VILCRRIPWGHWVLRESDPQPSWEGSMDKTFRLASVHQYP